MNADNNLKGYMIVFFGGLFILALLYFIITGQ